MRRLLAEFEARERHVCELMQIPRSTIRYRSRRDDGVLRERLLDLAREHPGFGYRRLHVLLRRDAVVINHKRLRRVYRESQGDEDATRAAQGQMQRLFLIQVRGVLRLS